MTWRRLLPGVTALEVLLVLTACAAGAVVYQGFFASLGALSTLGLACLTGGVTAALGHRRAWSTVLLAVAGLVPLLVFGLFRGDVTAVFDGMRGSWNRLLTAAVPADAWGALLVVPTLVVWAAAFSSVLLVLRSRKVLVPLVPPLASFLFAVSVAGEQTGGHLVATVVFLAGALPLVAVRTHRSTGSTSIHIGQSSPRSVTALVVVGLVVAASALVGVAGGQALPLGRHRFDPRDVLAPPVASTDVVSPLSQLKSQLKVDPPRTLFTLEFEPGSPTRIDRVRTAALDVFDGTTWTSSDTYRVAGSHLTADPGLLRSRPVTARIELKALTGPHLPVIGWPSRLVADGDAEGRFGFDPGSGVVVSTTPGPQSLSYRVTGEIDDDAIDQAAQLATDSKLTPAPPADVPEQLRALVLAPYSLESFNRLSDLERDLHGHPYRLDVPPGHSYAAIAAVLAEGGRGGYAEQYAAAFAVVARMWGYRTRVAVGYRVNGGPQANVRVITTADAHAWPEVYVAGHGWVTFEPTGLIENVKVPAPPPDSPRVVPPNSAPSTLSAATPQDPQRPPGVVDDQGPGLRDVLLGTWLVAPVAGVLLVLVCGFVVIAKALRRRRRRLGPDPAAQVLGAWLDQLDRLTERGVSPPVSLTFHEVARHVRDRLGDAANPVEATAELATTATYAPEHLGDSDAGRAWQLADQLQTTLYPRRLSLARLRATLDPRPLWTVWAGARQRRRAGESLEMGRYR